MHTLDPAFARLSKPAQRALMNEGIYTPKDLAKYTRREIAALHGIGPSAFPILESALQSAGLKFRESSAPDRHSADPLTR